jgi:predicted dehydrogenase
VTGIALLGSGFMARVHASAYAGLGDRARVRVVCALTEEEAAPLAEQLGAEPSDDWEAAVAAPDVDAVDVCLPTPLHRRVAEHALGAGRHVLLEKPVALTLEDADAIGAAAEAAGRVLMIGHALRFMPEVVELLRVVEDGELGRPLSATALRLSAPPDWNDWMLDPERSGGTPIDLMVHDFDIAAALLGPARSVHARAVADGRHVSALVEHSRGEAFVEGSHAMPPSFPFTSGLRVLCEGGVLEHRFVAGADEDGGNIGGGVMSRLRIHPADGPVREFAEAHDPWAAEIEHFVECVETGAAPRDGTFAQGRAALAVGLAVRESVVRGGPVAVAAGLGE